MAIASGAVVKFRGKATIYDSLLGELGVLADPPGKSVILEGALTNFGISKIRVTYLKSGTDDTNHVYQTATLPVSTAKISTALADLVGKKYQTFTITEARVARRRIFI